MQLDEFIKSKCKWHLGYNQTSIPAGDLARIEEALNNVQDSFWVSKIIEQVGLSSALVGSIFLALSTSFPEIVACLISLFKYGKNDFVLGNIIGSNIANFTIFSIINLLFVIPLPSFAISSLILILIA